MRRKITVGLVLLMISASIVNAAEPLTKAEKTEYAETSLYQDVMDFIQEVQKGSDFVKIVSFCESYEGRNVPLVILSEEGIGSFEQLGMTGKNVVLIQANIHAGEIEGKEASQMLIRDIAIGKLSHLLKNQVVLVIPILNADGNDKLSASNRRDDGPELAGSRPNGQNLDLNRDYPKLETPEIKALVGLFNTWDPVLVVDMHTKNGSYHRAQVTYTTCLHPDSHADIRGYMWNDLFPSVEKIMRKTSDYDAMPYGNFKDRLDPSQGWNNHAFDARYGSNYVGLRNRFCILDENYPHVDFKTRVLASYAFIRSVLEYTDKHIVEMREVVDRADKETAASFHESAFTLEYEVDKLFDLTVKSYVFKNEKISEEHADQIPSWWNGIVVRNTGEPKDYLLPYYSKANPTSTVELPEGYIILPGNEAIVEKLREHGLTVEKLKSPITSRLENFIIEEIKPVDYIYQGHVFIDVKGRYETVDTEIPDGACYITLKQPLARVAAFLLEPESTDSFLRWGMLNRFVVRQWGRNRPGIYPIYRVHGTDSNDNRVN